MKRLLVIPCLFLIICCASVNASADTFTLVGSSGVTSSNRLIVGPLSGLLNSASVSVVCTDFDHHVSFGQTWNVQVLTFSDLGGGVLHQYQEAKTDRKSTRLNSSHSQISYAVFCLKKNMFIVDDTQHHRLEDQLHRNA